MAKHLRGLLLVLLLLSPAALARVISYAPYTDKVAFRGYQSRLARHFVLMEADAGNAGPGYVFNGKLVLYDSREEQEPRVIYPTGNGLAPIRFAALYQSGSGDEPVILLGTHERGDSRRTSTLISIDGGRTWRRIPELDGKEVHSDGDVDTGGPWTRGLAAPVRIGSASFPFIVSYRGSVWAIPANGAPRQLATTDPQLDNTLVAQNREGTVFVIRTGLLLVISDLAGRHATLETEVDSFSQYSGWITPEGSVYLLRRRTDGRFLSLYRNGRKTFVAAPYGYSREPDNGPGPGGNPMSLFAVPAYDFNGAWIIQRDRGKPTTLSLHTPGGTLQQMWADVSGPEVEALHAGSSGERLLVQVHRERMVQVPFRDPALAVWKIGEPAPRSYDELFLNEGATKGFVHVDPERIAAGDLFVFDSGFVQQGWAEPVSPPIGGGGDVVQEWGVVRASLKQRLVLPGVARLPGAFNSYWLTDIVIYNPLDQKQTVDVHFVPLGQEIEISTSTPVVVTLEPREIRVVADVVKSLFKLENGGGALYFIPQVGVNVTGRTYTRAGETAGTFGFGMLAIDFFNAASPRFPLSFAGAFPAQHFRTNVLLTDTSGRGSEARMQAYGVSGTMGFSDITVAAPTSGVMQTNGVAGSLGLSSHQTGGLVLTPTRGTAIATVVAIDNRTNDPTYFPPDLPASMIRTIPVIGHLDGAHGSRFRSDLYLLNLSDSARSVTLEVKKWDSNEWPRQLRFTLLPNEARVIEDALSKLFGMEGLARLRYWSDGAQGDASGVRVTSRTYNIDANGGTHGCLIPPLNSFQSATAGEALEIVGITGGSGFRTNVGLVELSAGPNGNRVTNVRLFLFDEKGKPIDQFTVALPVAGGMQINDLFAARGLTPPPAARLVIQVLDAMGLVGAYATLTDNITNDSTFLGANLAATPE